MDKDGPVLAVMATEGGVAMLIMTQREEPGSARWITFSIEQADALIDKLKKMREAAASRLGEEEELAEDRRLITEHIKGCLLRLDTLIAQAKEVGLEGEFWRTEKS